MSSEPSDIERKLDAESLPRDKRRLPVVLLAGLLLVVAGAVVFGARRWLANRAQHEVVLGATGDCAGEVQVLLQLPGEPPKGWEPRSLPVAEKRTLSGGDLARITVNTSVACPRASCVVTVDRQEALVCTGAYPACEYPVPENASDVPGCHRGTPK